jgi:hypothetical protein
MATQRCHLAALALVLLLMAMHTGVITAGKVTVHNASDCCCVNLPGRSSRWLVSSVDECIASCRGDGRCHAAAMVYSGVARQCNVAGPTPPGMACCIHKGHFDGLHPFGKESTVIDMGTSSGPCPAHPSPRPSPSPPAPPVGPPPPGSASGEQLRPHFHFHRLQGEMNDPNGLQWRHDDNGAVSYELFYQHRPTDAHACYGSEGGGDVWAHAWSPDLLHWTRLPDNKGHMVCASTGGGITLPPGFRGPHGEEWLAANLGSAPGGTTRDASVGRGLKLWTSNDSKLLNDFAEYLPPGTKTVDPVTKQNDVRPPAPTAAGCCWLLAAGCCCCCCTPLPLGWTAAPEACTLLPAALHRRA